MVDFIGIGTALSWIGIVYFLVAIGTAFFFWKMMRSLPAKIIASVITIALFYSWPVKHHFDQKKVIDAQQSIQDQALAHYKMRCQSTGFKIYKTVEDVEGIFLIKLRPKNDRNDWARSDMNDPYGSEVGGNGYIESFLEYLTDKGAPVTNKTVRPGYKYVEAIDASDSKRYRYIPRFDKKYPQPLFDRFLSEENTPRYGITYEDISTPEDRKLWIAGGSIKIIDLQTNETIAERIGYLMDAGQGNTNGGRLPWAIAQRTNACPKIDFPLTQTRQFVEQVLKPKQ